MQLSATIRGPTWRFESVKEVLAKANPPKSGDDLAGVSARDAVERVAARAALSQLTMADLRENPVVPYEADELTRLVEDTLDDQAFRAVKNLTVGQMREWLLDTTTTGPVIRSISAGIAGRCDDGGAMGAPRTAARVCRSEFLRNRRRPASISQRTTPTANRSMRASAPRPSAYSGAQ